MWTETDALPGKFGGPRYPEGFLRDYEPIECLMHGALGETLFVRSKDGTRFVARCRFKGTVSLPRDCEGEILPRLHHARIPAFVAAYEGNDMAIVVREFVPGMSLDEYAHKHLCTPEFVWSAAMQLCDILNYLHRQNPPIIHRDIKPQNVILDKDGRVHLIDFGISRVHRDGACTDTVCFGTMSFAPPEQYGFAQTDCRADIFSLGVLMGWLLTGETFTQNMLPRICNRRLARIVQKCTAFAPENRYASALQVKAALQGKRVRNSRFPRARIAVPVVLAALFLALAIPILQEPVEMGSVEFREPLIEQAVRKVLHKKAGDRIYEDELKKVTGIFAFGLQAFDNFQAFSNMSIGDSARGDASSLQDITMLPNLETLTIGYQNISDLTPLRFLKHLQYIDLKHNPIVDLSPLSGKISLNTLCLFDTDVTDLTPLSTCCNVTHLDVGMSGITSMKQLKAVPFVECVTICNTPLDSLDGAEVLGRLRELSISSTHVRDLSPLRALEGFERLEVDREMYKEMEIAPGMYPFDVECVSQSWHTQRR